MGLGGGKGQVKARIFLKGITPSVEGDLGKWTKETCYFKTFTEDTWEPWPENC